MLDELRERGLMAKDDPPPGPAEPDDDPETFAFQTLRLREPRRWSSVVRIGVTLTLVAGALAAALYYLGYVIKLQLDRLLGS